MITGLGRGLVLEGIARTLNISKATVQKYEDRARAKLGAATRVEAVLIHQRCHRFCHTRTDTPTTGAQP